MRHYIHTLITLCLLIGSSAMSWAEFNPTLPPEPATRYPVMVGVTPQEGGKVSGEGNYTRGSSVTIRCTLNKNYELIQWTLNGNSYSTQQSFTYTVGDSTAQFIAHLRYVDPNPGGDPENPPFQPSLPGEPSSPSTTYYSRVYLSTSPVDAGWFDQESGVSYQEGEHVQFCAHNTENYVLDGWYIGEELISRDACTEIEIPVGDITLTARYKLINNPVYSAGLHLRTNIADACQFSRQADERFVEGTNVNICLTQTSKDEFLGWYNGTTLVTTDECFTYTTGREDVTFWAMFRAVYNPTLPGEPTGGSNSTVDNKPTTMIEAEYKEGWEFYCWDDGNTNNPRSVYTEDKNKYTPQYKPATYDIKLHKDICEGEYVDFGAQRLETEGIYTHHLLSRYGGDSAVTLYLYVHPVCATPLKVTIKEGDTYVLGTETLTTSGIYSQTYTSQWGCDSIVTLTLSVVSDTQYTLTLQVNDETFGSTSGTGKYFENEYATVYAIANEGYEFVQWNDGNTDNPRTIQITEDTYLTAEFTQHELTSIATPNTQAVIIKTLRDGHIYILRDGKTYTMQGCESR